MGARVLGISFDEYSVYGDLLDERDYLVLPEVSTFNMSLSEYLLTLNPAIQQEISEGRWKIKVGLSPVQEAEAARCNLQFEHLPQLFGAFILEHLKQHRLIYQTNQGYRLYIGCEDFIREVFTSPEVARQKFHRDVQGLIASQKDFLKNDEQLARLGDLVYALVQTRLP